MSRFLRGRTMYDGRLNPPVRVFPPDPPVQKQQTIMVVAVPPFGRIARVNHRTNSRLSPPAVITVPGALPPSIQVGLATRPRPTRYSLGAPKVTGILAPVLTPVLVKRQAAGAVIRMVGGLSQIGGVVTNVGSATLFYSLRYSRIG